MEAWRRYKEKSLDWVRRLKVARRGQPFDTTDQEYRRRMHEVLLEHKFAGCPSDYLQSAQFSSDLTEEQYRRVDRFHTCLIPWLGRVFRLAGARVIEIGSGTGSSTLAFAPHVGAVHCFEIDPKAVSVAKARLACWGIGNVTFEEERFDRHAPLLLDESCFDAVLLVAVLEHLHFREFKEILPLAFEKLRPGGCILVAETPNRLSVTDYHTSWIDFFQWLPPEVGLEYYRCSQRPHFVHDIGKTIAVHGPGSAEVTERFVRWGRGISYHDFELALGREVHDMIVLDGWEKEVRPLAPVFKDDEILAEIFKRWDVRANKAFSRSWLYFVIRKPG
jgi:SAM-dependent methyltransferase